MITCASLFGVSYKPCGLNSNTFLDSSNCFARLRENCFGSKWEPINLLLRRITLTLLPHARETRDKHRPDEPLGSHTDLTFTSATWKTTDQGFR